MYHDQATIPMKLVGFGDAVNVTLGLPIVRTSVDHGNGYDIAGKDRARRSEAWRRRSTSPCCAKRNWGAHVSRSARPALAVSIESVTGPSLSTSTRMSARKRPVATPGCRRASATNRS